MVKGVLPPLVSATVIVGVCGPVLFVLTVYVTVPLPVPDAPEVTDARDASLDVAVHTQLAPEAVTSNVPLPPAAPQSAVFGFTV